MVIDTTAWLALVFQLVAFYLVPVLLWIGLVRGLGAGWRWIGLGAVTWLCALPAILAVPLGAVVAFGHDDPVRSRLIWGIALSFTAGVVEETSRYLWYRRSPALRDPEGRRFALLAGAGHGGTEAFVLGLQFAIGLVLAVVYVPENLPAEFATSAGITKLALIGGVSRMAFVIGHIGLSLMVWRAVSRRRPGWLVGAIGLHAALDLLAMVLPSLFPGTDWLVWIPVVALVAFAIAELAAEIRGPRPTMAEARDVRTGSFRGV